MALKFRTPFVLSPTQSRYKIRRQGCDVQGKGPKTQGILKETMTRNGE